MPVKVTNTVNLKDIKVTDKNTMLKAGGIAVSIVKRRSEKGLDYKGRSFDGYSTASALMPISQKAKSGGNTAKMRKHYNSQQKWTRKKRSQSTAKWVWVEGGYKQFRNIQGRKTNVVDLTFSGRTLRNFRPKRATKRSVLIGFTGESARIAFWLNRKRVFMRITRKAEILKLKKPMEAWIRKEIKK